MAEFEKSSTRQPWPSCHSEKFPRPLKNAKLPKIMKSYAAVYFAKLRCADVGIQKIPTASKYCKSSKY